MVLSANGFKLHPWASVESKKKKKKKVECLKDICPDPGNAGELQLAALCWGLACTYDSIVSTIQHLQGEDKASGSDKQIRETVAKTGPTVNGLSGPCS